MGLQLPSGYSFWSDLDEGLKEANIPRVSFARGSLQLSGFKDAIASIENRKNVNNKVILIPTPQNAS